MKKELGFFTVAGAYGWRQEWFDDYLMQRGGCGAVTVCDCCIYLKKYKGFERLYPFPVDQVTKENYLRFAGSVSRYLYPRRTGIDTLSVYMEAFRSFLRSVGENGLAMEGFSSRRSDESARAAVVSQIDGGWPVPYLTLRHKNAALYDYIWHWYLLTGYDDSAGFSVKTVTNGEWLWQDFSALRETGYRQRDGMVLLKQKRG